MKSISSINPLVYIIFISLCWWIISTSTVSAFGPTHALRVELDDTHTAYAISYKFNFMNRGVLAPALAHRASSTWPITTKLPPLTYTLRAEDGQPVLTGKTIDTIFSRASSTDAMFALEEGEKGEYTLIVLHEHAADDKATHMTIDQLPFILIKDGIEGEVSTYPASDMAKYTTKAQTKSSFIMYPLED